MPTAVVSDQLAFEPFVDLFAKPDASPLLSTVAEAPEHSLAHVWIAWR